MEKKYFLKLEGVSGESENPRHPGAIEILGFTWGSNHVNSSGGHGRASIHDVHVSKKTDRSSHYLFVASSFGRGFSSGVITVEDVGARMNVVRSVRIELSSILISTYSTDGKMDSFGLNFEGMKFIQ